MRARRALSRSPWRSPIATRREGAGGRTEVGGGGGGDRRDEDEKGEDSAAAAALRLALACGGGTAASPRAWTESQKASTKEDQRCFVLLLGVEIWPS